MFKNVIKVVLIFLFIPIVIASTKALFLTMESLNFLNFRVHFLIGGFFIYPIFHIIIFKPIYIYAIGHEIVHVLATWLCGGKVTSFHISHDGGSVTTTKTNAFITLSPYFVPIHAIFLFILYWALSRFFDMSRFSDEFMFFMGFLLGFHLIMTVEVMKTKQVDISQTGYFFSVPLIYIANIFISVLVLYLLFKSDISLTWFLKNVLALSKEIYINIFNALFK